MLIQMMHLNVINCICAVLYCSSQVAIVPTIVRPSIMHQDAIFANEVDVFIVWRSIWGLSGEGSIWGHTLI